MSLKRGVSRCISSGSLRGRKGQVTIFIIIGIVILFSFAGIMYVTRSAVVETTSAAGEPISISVPTDFEPIQLFTEDCVLQLGTRAFNILGEQGGYIDATPLGDFSLSNPTDGSGIVLDANLVPYWHYNSEPNPSTKVIISSGKPPLHSEEGPLSVEEQVNSYVEENLDECLIDYEPFETAGFRARASGEKEVTTRVGPGHITFLLEMPLSVTKGSASTQLEKFFVRLPLNFQHYYDVAARISEAQTENSFLEKQGMELISVYSGLDPSKFAPTSDVGYDLFPVNSWNEVNLKQKFQELLTSYVPMLRFLGSSNFYYSTYPEGNRLAQNIIDNFVVPLPGADDLRVSFDYFGWEPYFATNSKEGEIQPDHIFIQYGPLTYGTQRYDTHYDASYPVLVTVEDVNALDGEGYTFLFGMESNIRNNQPAEHEKEIVPRTTRAEPIACKTEQRDTELIKAVVVDSFTKEPVELVKLGFTLPDIDDCHIGVTDKAGVVEEKYPAVYGGVVNLLNEDYLPTYYPLDTYKHKDQPLILGQAVAHGPSGNVIEVHKLHPVRVSVKKKELQKCLKPLVCEYTTSGIIPVLDGLSILPYKDISCKADQRQCFSNEGSPVLDPGIHVLELVATNSLSRFNDYYFVDSAKPLEALEEVMLTLERVGGFNDRVKNEPLTVSVSLTGDQTEVVNLAPGKYKVTGIVTLQQPIKIPAERRCFAYTMLTWDKEECQTIEGQTIDSYVVGNMAWDTEETYLEITPEQLYTTDDVTLHVLTQDILAVPETVSTVTKQCAGISCVPGVGCVGEVCSDESIDIAGRVIEDTQVVADMVRISKIEEVRRALEPIFG